MENIKVQNYCRFVTVCDFLFVLVFVFVQSFAVGVWFGLEIYIFIPIGTWAVAGVLAGVLTIVLSACFIVAVLYGAVILWKEEGKQKIYNFCLIVSIFMSLLTGLSEIVLNVLGLRNLWINLLGFIGLSVLQILNIVGFWMKRKKGLYKKKADKEEARRKEIFKKETLEEKTGIEIGIEVIKGEYKGALFHMDENESITLGTQPEFCQMIFCNPYISRRHCTVCYKPELQKYEIVDHSKNGTFWMNGDRLPLGEVCICTSGTVFTMDRQNQMLRFI